MRTTTVIVACILTVSLAMPAYAGRAIIAAATCVPGDPADLSPGISSKNE